MTNTLTKNYWILTLDKYQPVLVTVDGDMVLEANFSLAEEATDSGIRLHRLTDFIQECKHHVEHCSEEVSPLLKFSISQKVVEQMIYLSYWKNYQLEFHMGNSFDNIIVAAGFLNQPQLSCVLDIFPDGFDPFNELQAWLDFLCSIISDHAEIWQIHMVVHKSVYDMLAASKNARVFIEIENDEIPLTVNGLGGLLSPTF